MTKSWKTTVAGIAAAVLTALTALVQTGRVTMTDAAVAVGLAVLGWLAKDADVTGGNRV